MKQLSFFPKEQEPDWTANDWQTPDDIAIAMSKLIKKSDSKILEPCAGDGQIAKFLPQGSNCVEVNIIRYQNGESNAPNCMWFNIDFLNDCNWLSLLDLKQSLGSYDLIIGNPPFSRCVEFIERSLELLNPKNSEARILFLLPIDWNCSKARAAAWKKLNAHIYHIYQIEGRVAFLDANGVAQSRRQVCDAVFDIRPGNLKGGVSYL